MERVEACMLRSRGQENYYGKRTFKLTAKVSIGLLKARFYQVILDFPSE